MAPVPYSELTRLTVALLLAVPAIYLALVALGRWLRRRAGVRLGWPFQMLAIAVAFFLPLQYLAVSPWIVQALGAMVAMLGTVFVLALVRRFVWEYYFGQVRHVDIPQFMRDVLALVVFLVAALLVLTLIFDVKIPGLVAGSGILAVILGLAMQDTLGNIVAGFAIHFEKPFRRGDWLIFEKRHAEVMELNWRSTRLRTNDNIYLDIPNKQLTGGAIVNLTYPARLHAMRLSVGLEHSAPPNEAKEALLRAVQHAAGVLPEPPPKVFLNLFDETALTYEVKFWLEDHARYNEVVDAIRTNIWYELQRRHLRISVPRRTLQIASAEDTIPSPSPRETCCGASRSSSAWARPGAKRSCNAPAPRCSAAEKPSSNMAPTEIRCSSWGAVWPTYSSPPGRNCGGSPRSAPGSALGRCLCSPANGAAPRSSRRRTAK
jgi:small-conductance mechanosensitive channel